MPHSYHEIVTKDDFIALYKWKMYGKKRPNPILQNDLNVFENIYELQLKYGTLPFIVPYVEICVTTRCSLRCEHCANFIPAYGKEARDYPTETICENMGKMLSAIDSIKMLRILGGEPLLHDGLATILRTAASFEKVGRIAIVTNGTLLPSQDVLAAARESRACFVISDYGACSRKADELEALLAGAGVACTRKKDPLWRDHGCQTHGYSLQDLRDVYQACDVPCKTLVDGELHICPRSAHGAALGWVNARDEDFVSVPSLTVPQLRQRFRALYDLDFVEACRLCKKPCDRSAVPAGAQLAKTDRLHEVSHE